MRPAAHRGARPPGQLPRAPPAADEIAACAPAGRPRRRLVPRVPRAPAGRNRAESPSLSSFPLQSKGRDSRQGHMCDMCCDTPDRQTWELGWGEHEGFLGLRRTHDTVVVGTGHCAFVQTHRAHAAKSDRG